MPTFIRMSHTNSFPFRPGEELAAAGFVALVFYMFLDLNIGIYRIFKRKQGLYYWCMLLGALGCVTDAVAVVLKYLLPNSERIWPLYTFLILAGWTVYAPAQLLVLYSRLHLVNRNRRLQQGVLVLIVSVATLMIVPTWVLVWQAFNPYNAHLSALYSPREAIIDRCTQIGYTLAECIVGGIYIWSLAKLLSLKSSLRQRRVMTDLLYVNVIAISLDVLTVVLVFLNQGGISHPVQDFSYLLKLKLEFIVLNQLMAVAARGIKNENFAERRYHHPSTHSESTSPTTARKSSKEGLSQDSTTANSHDSTAEIKFPPPTLPKMQGTSYGLASQGDGNNAKSRKWPMKAKFKKHNDDEEDEEEEIGLHVWEVGGKMVMEVPWFREERRG